MQKKKERQRQRGEAREKLRTREEGGEEQAEEEVGGDIEGKDGERQPYNFSFVSGKSSKSHTEIMIIKQSYYTENGHDARTGGTRGR